MAIFKDLIFNFFALLGCRSATVQDLGSVDSSKEDCGIKFYERSDCTHFNYWGNKCILKKAPSMDEFSCLNNAVCGKLKKLKG